MNDTLNTENGFNIQKVSPYIKLDHMQEQGQMQGENTQSLQQIPSSMNSVRKDIRFNVLMPSNSPFDQSIFNEIFDSDKQEDLHENNNESKNQNKNSNGNNNLRLNINEIINYNDGKIEQDGYIHDEFLKVNRTNFLTLEEQMSRATDTISKGGIAESQSQKTKTQKSNLYQRNSRKSQNIKTISQLKRTLSIKDDIHTGNQSLWGYLTPQQQKKNFFSTSDSEKQIWKKKWIRILGIVSKMKTIALQSAIFFRPHLLRQFQVRLINDISSNQEISQVASLSRSFSFSRFQRLVSFRTYRKIIKAIIKYFGCVITLFLQFKILCQQILIKIFKYIPLFHNLSTFYMIWEAIIFISSSILFLYLPFEYCFSYPRPMTFNFYIRYLCPIIFGFDMFIRANTKSSESGTFTQQHLEIFANYMKQSFLTDFLSILSLYDHIFGYQAAYFLFFLRLSQSFRIVEVIREQFLLKTKIFGLISLFYLLVQVIYFGHLFSCLWNAIGIEQSQYEEGWIIHYNKTNESISSKYLLSFYFAMVTMTTIGYGDITAQSNLEKLIMIFMTFISCGVFGYTINSIGNILYDFKKKRDIYLQELAKINQYFKLYNVDLVLQGRARKYIQYLYSDERKDKMCSIKSLSTLSEYLQNEIKTDVYIKRLEQIQVFNDIMTEKIKVDIALLMKEEIYSPDQIILDATTVGEPQMYFVHQGLVQQFAKFDSTSTTQKEIRVYRENQYFGLLNFLKGVIESDFSFKSVGITTLLQISQSDFISVLKKHDVPFEKYSFLVDQVKFNRQYGIIHEYCPSCLQKNHVLKNCPFLFYEGKREIILRKYFKQINETIKNFKRKQGRGNFNTLLYQKEVSTIAHELISDNMEMLAEIGISSESFDPDEYEDLSDNYYFNNSKYSRDEEDKELKHINTGKFSENNNDQGYYKDNAESHKSQLLAPSVNIPNTKSVNFDEEIFFQDHKLHLDEQQTFMPTRKNKKPSIMDNCDLHTGGGSNGNISANKIPSQNEIESSQLSQRRIAKKTRARSNTNERNITSQFSHNTSSQNIKQQNSINNVLKEFEHFLRVQIDHQPSQCNKFNCHQCYNLLNVLDKMIHKKKGIINQSQQYPNQDLSKKGGSGFYIKQENRQFSSSQQPIQTSIKVLNQYPSSASEKPQLKIIEKAIQKQQNVAFSNDYYLLNFDKAFSFHYYYPHSNYENVVNRLNEIYDQRFCSNKKNLISIIFK